MKSLLYCIFHTSPPCHPPDCPSVFPEDLTGGSAPLGVSQQSVFLLTQDALSVAVSRIASSALVTDTPRLLAYHKVITWFHHDRAVIPLRYGCLFEDDSSILQFLAARRHSYETLLAQLADCVEMGIRAILEPDEASPCEHSSGSGTLTSSLQSALLSPVSPGTTYLTARRQHYTRQEQLIHQQNRLTEQIDQALSPLFLQRKQESTEWVGKRVLSLYFLVPRERVIPFRQVFQRISRQEPVQLLLSGPWPPYNFVSDEQRSES